MFRFNQSNNISHIWNPSNLLALSASTQHSCFLGMQFAGKQTAFPVDLARQRRRRRAHLSSRPVAEHTPKQTIQSDIFVLPTLWMIFNFNSGCAVGPETSEAIFHSHPLESSRSHQDFLPATNLYTHFRFHGYFATEISSNRRAAKIWYSTSSVSFSFSLFIHILQ